MTTNTQHGLDDQMPDWRGTPRQLFEAVRQERNATKAGRQKTLYTTYYEPLKLVGYDGDTFTVSCSKSKLPWCRQWAIIALKRSLKRELRRDVKVWFVKQVEPEAQMSLPLFAPDADGVIEFEELGDEKWWE